MFQGEVGIFAALGQPMHQFVDPSFLNLFDFSFHLQAGTFRETGLDQTIDLDFEAKGKERVGLVSIGHDLAVCFLAHLAIDLGNLLHPASAFPMLQVKDGRMIPMKMIGNKRYLLVQGLKRVAA